MHTERVGNSRPIPVMPNIVINVAKTPKLVYLLASIYIPVYAKQNGCLLVTQA